MKKKGVIIFLLLAITVGFLFAECERRAGAYEADPIGTEQRQMQLDGFTVPLRHILLAQGPSGYEPVVFEDQGFITYAAGRWLCQLSPAASYVPAFEQPGNEKELTKKMAGAENTIAYLQEQGYQPIYAFSYFEEVYIVAQRAGREYVMPTRLIDESSAALYADFQRPRMYSQFLSSIRDYVRADCPADAVYGWIF